MTLRRLVALFAFGAGCFLTSAAPARAAGPDGDALGKCLVASATPVEKTTLVRWIFVVLAHHPEVAGVSSVTPAQHTELSKAIAKVLERLLTEACMAESRAVIRNEGIAAFEQSFSQLGQVAARELFTHPRVGEGLAEMTKYLDEKKLSVIVAPQP
jgi:hypothetical protein